MLILGLLTLMQQSNVMGQQVTEFFINEAGETVDEIFACSQQYRLRFNVTGYSPTCSEVWIRPLQSGGSDYFVNLGPFQLGNGNIEVDLQNLCALDSNEELEVAYEICTGTLNPFPNQTPGYWRPGFLFGEADFQELNGDPYGETQVGGCRALYRRRPEDEFVREWSMEATSGQTNGLIFRYDGSEDDGTVVYEVQSVQCLHNGLPVTVIPTIENREFRTVGGEFTGTVTVIETFSIAECTNGIDFVSDISYSCHSGLECDAPDFSTCIVTPATRREVDSELTIRTVDGELDVCGEPNFAVEAKFKNGGPYAGHSINSNIKKLNEIRIPIDLGVLTEDPTDQLVNNTRIVWSGGQRRLRDIDGLGFSYVDDGTGIDEGYHRYVSLKFTDVTDSNSPFIDWYEEGNFNCFAENDSFSVFFYNLHYDPDRLLLYGEGEANGQPADQIDPTNPSYCLFGNREGSLQVDYERMCGFEYKEYKDDFNFSNQGAGCTASIDMSSPDVSCGHDPNQITALLTIPEENNPWSFGLEGEEPVFFDGCEGQNYKINIDIGQFIKVVDGSTITVTGADGTSRTYYPDGPNNSLDPYANIEVVTTEVDIDRPHVHHCTGETTQRKTATTFMSFPLDPDVIGAGSQVSVSLAVTTSDCPETWHAAMEPDWWSHFAISLDSVCDINCPDAAISLCRDEVDIFWRCCGPCNMFAEDQPVDQTLEYNSFAQSTLDFSFQRITPGFTNADMTTLVTLTPDHKLQRAYEGDIIRVESHGVLNPRADGVLNAAFQILYADSDNPGDPLQYFDLLEGKFELTFNDFAEYQFGACPGVTLPPASCPEPVDNCVQTNTGHCVTLEIDANLTTNLNGDTWELLFDLPLDTELPPQLQAAGVHDLQAFFEQDQHTCQLFNADVRFVANLQVADLPDNDDRLIPFDGMIRGQFASEIRPDEWQGSCDDWGVLFEILNPLVETSFDLHYATYEEECLGWDGTGSACEALFLGQFQLLQAKPGEDEFPGEYRPVFAPFLSAAVPLNSDWAVTLNHLTRDYNSCEDGGVVTTELTTTTGNFPYQTLQTMHIEADGSENSISMFGEIQQECRSGVDQPLDLRTWLYYSENLYKSANTGLTCPDFADCTQTYNPFGHLVGTQEDYSLNMSGTLNSYGPDLVDISSKVGTIQRSAIWTHDSQAPLENFYFDFTRSTIDITGLTLLNHHEETVQFLETSDGIFEPVENSQMTQRRTYRMMVEYDIKEVACDQLSVVVDYGYRCFGESVCETYQDSFDIRVPEASLVANPQLYVPETNGCNTGYLIVEYFNDSGSDIQELSVDLEFDPRFELAGVIIISEDGNDTQSLEQGPAGVYQFDLGLPLAPESSLTYLLVLAAKDCDTYETTTGVTITTIAKDICGNFLSDGQGSLTFSNTMTFDALDACNNTCYECSQTCCDADFFLFHEPEDNVICGTDAQLLWSDPPPVDVGGVFEGPGVYTITFGETFYLIDPEVAGLGEHMYTYTYTHEDGSTCQVSESFTILDGLELDSYTVDVNCLGDPGELLVSVTNAAPGEQINFTIEPNVGTQSTVSATSSSFSNLPAGLYTVTATSELTGCQEVKTYKILQTIPDIKFRDGAGVEHTEVCEDHGWLYIYPYPSFSTLDVNNPTITGATGNWKGRYYFNPRTAGPGTHPITYTYSDKFGNECEVTRYIEVLDAPSVEMVGLPSLVCVDNGPIFIHAMDENGQGIVGTSVTTEPPGVIETETVSFGGDPFDIHWLRPDWGTAGQTYSIEFVYELENGCSDTDFHSITIDSCEPDCSDGDPDLVFDCSFDPLTNELCVTAEPTGSVFGWQTDVIESRPSNDYAWSSADTQCQYVSMLDVSNLAVCYPNEDLPGRYYLVIDPSYVNGEENIYFTAQLYNNETGELIYNISQTQTWTLSSSYDSPSHLWYGAPFDLSFHITAETLAGPVFNQVNVSTGEVFNSCSDMTIAEVTSNAPYSPSSYMYFRRTITYDDCSTFVKTYRVRTIDPNDPCSNLEIIDLSNSMTYTKGDLEISTARGSKVSDSKADDHIVYEVASEDNVTLSVSPNPARDYINIELSSNTQDQGLLTLIDQTGKQMLSLQVKLSAAQNESIRMDIQSIPPGMYLVRFEGSKTQLSSTVIIQ